MAVKEMSVDDRYDDSKETTRLITSHSESDNGSISSKSRAQIRTPLIRQVAVTVACFYMQAICTALSTSLGVIYPELINKFSAPRSQAALVQSIYMGTMRGGGVLFTVLIAKHGVGLAVMLGSVIATIGLLVSSQATSVVLVIVFTGLVAGIGESVSYLGSFVAVSRIFTKNRKVALAVLTFSATVGQTLFPIVIDLLLQTYSLSGTFIILAGFTFQTFACGFVIHASKRFLHLAATDKDVPDDSSTSGTQKLKLLKDSTLLQLIALAFLNSITAPVEQWFLVDITVLRGYTRQEGSVLLSVMGIFGFVGRVLGTVLLRVGRGISAGVHSAYSLALFSGSHLVIIMLTDLAGMTGGAVLRGATIGITIAVQPSFQIELRGLASYAQTAAIYNLASGSGQILGGYIGGVIADLSGSYDLMFYISAGFGFVMALMVFRLWVVVIRNKTT